MFSKAQHIFGLVMVRLAVPVLGLGFWLLTEGLARGSLTFAADWALHHGWQFALNLGIVLAFWFMIVALAGGLRLAFWIFSILLIPLAMMNAMKLRANGFPLFPWDLAFGNASLTASSLFTHVTLKMGLIAGGFVAAAALVLHLLPWFRRSLRYTERVVLAALSILVWCSVYSGKPYPLQHKANISTAPWDPVDIYERNGFLLSSMLNLPMLDVQKPLGYNRAKIDTLLSSGSPSASDQAKAGVKPNIIVVLSEAFWDPTIVPGIKFSEDPVPFLHSLLKRYPGGWLQTPQFGGGTANVEFEVLTSQSMRFLPSGSLPYVNYVNKGLDSLASILTRQGYAATAINPLDNWFFVSREAYKNMGFQRFVSSEFMEPKLEGLYIADNEVAQTVIRETERTPGPDIVFTNTMENHWPFYPGKFKQNTIRAEGSFSNATRGIMETYAQGIHSADSMLKTLVEHYSASKEPTMIVFFGDHLPALNTEEKVYQNIGWVRGDTEEQDPDYWRKMYRTPFVVWDNFLPQHQEQLLMSPSYLGVYALQRAGLKGTEFTDYVGELYKTVPVIPPQNHYADLGIREEQLQGYRLLEYDAMFGKEFAYAREGILGRIVPPQFLLGDGEPAIASAAVTRAADGAAMLSVTGENFAPKAELYVDGSKADTERTSANALKARLPAGIAAGRHKIVVRLDDSKGFTLQTSPPFELEVR